MEGGFTRGGEEEIPQFRRVKLTVKFTLMQIPREGCKFSLCLSLELSTRSY